MVTQEMLEAAMVEAVKRGMFPKNALADQYITAWEDMRAVLEAAQPSAQRTCPYCKHEHDLRLACPEYKDFSEWRKLASRPTKDAGDKVRVCPVCGGHLIVKPDGALVG